MNLQSSILRLLLALIAPTAFAAVVERSVSPSQQFAIYGADIASRGAISDLAEKTKANLLATLRSTDKWQIPITINLLRPQANLPEIPGSGLRFNQTGFGLRLQIDLVAGSNIDPALVEREILRAILLEMIYRNQADLAPGASYVEPPDWLVDGLLALARGRDHTPLIDALASSNRIMTAAEFLEQRPALLDSPARTLWRAYAFALVQFLIDQSDGRGRLARYIDTLSQGSNDSLADLQGEFPELAKDAGGAWKASVVQLASDYQLLTFPESERELDRCLKTFASQKSTGADRLREITQRKATRSEAAALRQLSQRLLLLATRVNPILRPTIEEYEQIAGLTAAGRAKGMSARLTRAEALHGKISRRMGEIDDYMNWCEASKETGPSGMFTNYLNAAEEQIKLRPRRHDAFSVYLDAMEEQVEN